MAAVVSHILKTEKSVIRNIGRSLDTISSFSFPTLTQARLVGNAVSAEGVCGLAEMVAGKDRKHYMVGGKGGVGKTTCVASVAVKFANHGHPPRDFFM